jgi:hypothetical protein
MPPPRRPGIPSLAGSGDAVATASALVFALSSFMGWYSAKGALFTASVIGWHTGTLGKLVFFTGLSVLILLLLNATGLELPPAFPVGAAIAALGALGTIFVLVRLIDIPNRFAGLGRGVGLWISLIAGLAVTVAGLVKASEEI